MGSTKGKRTVIDDLTTEMQMNISLSMIIIKMNFTLINIIITNTINRDNCVYNINHICLFINNHFIIIISFFCFYLL